MTVLAQLNAKLAQSVAQACRNGFDLPSGNTIERASDLIVAIAGLDRGDHAIDIGVGPDGSVELVLGIGGRIVTVFVEQDEPGFGTVTRDRETGETVETDFETASQVVEQLAARAA
jgi:hypothetical protein